MNSLIGTIFQTGAIEFLEPDNEWAFRAIRATKGDPTAVPRVVFDPSKAAIELKRSPNLQGRDVKWLDRARLLLGTADKVFLKPDTGGLRFMQAVHDFGNHQQLITLGSQPDADDFAKKYWRRIKYFYAHRVDEFRFRLTKLVTFRDKDTPPHDRVELEARQVWPDGDPAPHVVFDATGAKAAVQIVEWRNDVKGKDSCRFDRDDMRVELRVMVNRQPLTFYHEYRGEFRNHAFEFEGSKLDKKIGKLAGRAKELEELRAVSDEN